MEKVYPAAYPLPRGRSNIKLAATVAASGRRDGFIGRADAAPLAFLSGNLMNGVGVLFVGKFFGRKSWIQARRVFML
jgi:hypothetical protein